MEEDTTDDTKVPAHVLPLFFTSKTQEIFDCKCDEQITEDSPYKIITKEQILQDFKDRAAISDFHPAKKIVENYPGDELLIVYDAAFQYGQNFYLITDEEQKNLLLNPPEQNEDVIEEEPEEEIEVRVGLRSPQPWISLGSEKEVVNEMLVPSREKMKFTISRMREYFGCPISFSDRIETDIKDVAVDCMSYEEQSESVMTKELEKGIQNIAVVRNSYSQTEWPCPKNAVVQYVPQTNEHTENIKMMTSDGMFDFIAEVIPRFELALQQNETLDIFTNDYLNLGEEDAGTFGSKSDNHLKEYQSFTDLQFSKNKTISDIQWHPSIKGLIAVSCMEPLSFYDRVDHLSQCLMTPSLILIWSFADPIHPLLLLEAPDDILCFKFNPSDPNIICGGCRNGQIILWELSEYSDHLKNHRNHGQGAHTNQNLNNLPSFFRANTQELSPMLRYCAVSSVEQSHRMAITDIQWIPDHIEIGRMGVVMENKSRYCSQIMTCSSDGAVLFWDTKSTKSTAQTNVKVVEREDTAFQHLDLTWKPLLKVTVHRLRGSGEFRPVKFLISEVHKNNPKPAHVVKQEEPREMEDHYMTFKKKDEGKILENISSEFYVATEDGELVYLDWKPTKDIDTGKIVSTRPGFCIDGHDTEIVALQNSPFIKDIFLTVGGWTFSIWKQELTIGALVQSHAHACKLTAGQWSPTRPGVFFIGKADGCIDIWDLLDKSHEPFLTQNVSPVPIMAIYPYQINKKQQLLAAGDEVGTLHIMEVSWNLKHATGNEQSVIENYLEREANRLQYAEECQNIPFVEIKDGEENKSKQVAELDEEWEERAKVDFGEYLELEKRILEELGLGKEELTD